MFRNIVIRILFSPLSLIYGIVVSCINFFYDIDLIKGSSFSIPVVGVGNLSIGGAGKTPHIEYMIELLKDYVNLSTLSRGYKRQTQGFRIVTPEDTALTVGDEPLQYRRKYNDIVVAVGESRAYAIPQIIQKYPQTQVVLLDDAFQHRSVKPGLNILLTAYDSLFTRDYLLPSGRLREWRSGYKRAQIIIVTKCPNDITKDQKDAIIGEIKPLSHQHVYFSRYEYGYPYRMSDPTQRISLDKDLDIILLSAIANTDYLMDYLQSKVKSVNEIEFEDHHNFDRYDIEKIIKVFGNIPNERKLIITTEKDAMRLEVHKDILQKNNIPVFILPAKVKFLFEEGESFNADLHNYLLNFEV